MAGVDCSSQAVPDGQRGPESAEKQGRITLGLVPVSGVTLNSVHYAVTSSSTPPVLIAQGDLPTPGSSKEFSFGLSLPVGTGYSISLSAASAETGDNVTCGGAFSRFKVTPNASTNFSLTLTCHDDSNGQIIGGVDVKTDACPKIVFDYVVATPGAAVVGKTSRSWASGRHFEPALHFFQGWRDRDHHRASSQSIAAWASTRRSALPTETSASA
jgi:hypothetical protein